ncbi:MAG: hypothetical protein ACOWW1_07920 [archaeon]
MENKRKMIPGSVVAVLLGVLLATPLLYPASVIAPTTGSKMFDVDISYVYLERQNSTLIHRASEPTIIDVPSTKSLFALNFTQTSENIPTCDAILEVYQIQIKSEEGLLDTLGNCQGMEIENASRYSDTLMNEFYGDKTNVPNSFSIVAYSDWAITKSRLDIGSHGSPQLWDYGSEPESLTVSVYRLGWFIVTGESSEAVILSDPEVVVEVQLEKYNEGYLYNSVIPEDQLDQIDLLAPFATFFDLINK